MPDLTREDLEGLRAILKDLDFGRRHSLPDHILAAGKKLGQFMRSNQVALLSAAEAGIEARATGANSAPVSDGWKLVPIEPTPEMELAAVDASPAVLADMGGQRLSTSWSNVECATVFKAMLSAAPPPPTDDGWLPIETAPKDGTTVLVFAAGNVETACWRDDGYNQKPRPYWDFGGFRVTYCRQNQPILWRPLPPAAQREGWKPWLTR